LQSRFFGGSNRRHVRGRGSPGYCSAPELCSAAGCHHHANWVIESLAHAILALKAAALRLSAAESMAKNRCYRAQAVYKPARYTSGLTG
jgi:hypothetical protein